MDGLVTDNSPPNAHIDNIATNNYRTLVSGWFLSPDREPKICFFHHAEALNQCYDFFPRQDVKEALQISDDLFCHGFIAVLDTSGVEMSALHFQVENMEYPLPGDSTTDEASLVAFLSIEEQHELFKKATQAGITPGPEGTSSLSSFEFCMDYCTCSRDGVLEFEGWLINEEVANVEIITHTGERKSILPFYNTFFRQDIIDEKKLKQRDLEAGLHGSFNAESLFLQTLVITLTCGYEWVEPIIHTNKPADKTSTIRRLLSDVNIYDADFFKEGYKQKLHQVQNIWSGSSLLDNAEPVTTHYGPIASSPIASIIIPIYGRYDFIQHQISFFSRDKDMCNHEIIYVLDDPKIEREFNITCHGVFETFKSPFKTVYAGKNFGFAGANNLGASQAKGQYILALNSDILPSQSGWISRLITKFRQLENPGIMGTTLTYEDETIQHFGMSFEKDAYYPGVWMNYHPNKGMPLHLVHRDSVQQVEAVTGACMLMERTLFNSLGGFDTCYILGDFEDSDLCLKARELGKEIYVDGEEKLYHLERLSQNLVQSGDWKFKLTLLNGLYQKEKWQTLISKVKEQHA